jgi:hypothetical protein
MLEQLRCDQAEVMDKTAEQQRRFGEQLEEERKRHEQQLESERRRHLRSLEQIRRDVKIDIEEVDTLPPYAEVIASPVPSEPSVNYVPAPSPVQSDSDVQACLGVTCCILLFGPFGICFYIMCCTK